MHRILFEITRTFAAATPDHEFVLRTAVEQTARFLHGYCVIGIVSDDRRWWTPVADFSEDAAARSDILRELHMGRMPLDGPHLTAQVARTGQTMVLHAPFSAAQAARLDRLGKGAGSKREANAIASLTSSRQRMDALGALASQLPVKPVTGAVAFPALGAGYNSGELNGYLQCYAIVIVMQFCKSKKKQEIINYS